MQEIARGRRILIAVDAGVLDRDAEVLGEGHRVVIMSVERSSAIPAVAVFDDLTAREEGKRAPLADLWEARLRRPSGRLSAVAVVDREEPVCARAVARPIPDRA